MPWFYGYGWIFPLIFFVFFFACFLICWRMARSSDSPDFACCPPLQKKITHKDSEEYKSKINKLKLEVENLKNTVNDENEENIKEQILELEKELESLKKNTSQ